MTRFVYISDTHLGAEVLGYQQQPGYPTRLPELLGLLEGWVIRRGGVSFAMHGGDMVQRASRENIRVAEASFRLCVPTYLCLGNHDLTCAGSLGDWLETAPRFFPEGAPVFTLALADCRLHVVPNHWEERPYLWDEAQDPRFSAEQLDWLESALAQDTDLPHILCTHSPALGVPVEQTGFDALYHAPPEAFSQVLLDLARRHSHLRLVLGGHSHINMHVHPGGAHFVTVSGFAETPFEFKLVEVGADGLSMSTHSLVGQVGFAADYEPSRAFVQGGPEDRGIVEAWQGSAQAGAGGTLP